MADHHCERVWLNPDGHPSTGSVVAYDGPGNWESGKNTTFLEVSDCNDAARLHQGGTDTTADMIAKMERLHGVIGRFIDHLKKKAAAENG